METEDLALLEEAFSAEIESALSKKEFLRVMQTKASARAERLVTDGYLRKVTESAGHGVTVSGYELTELGRMVYCISCIGEEDCSG